MTPSDPPRREELMALARAWRRLERRLDTNLSAVRGISFAEYRLLLVLASAPGSSASRVDLATALDVTPSGVTRALRPLEKLRLVKTIRSARDARLALASLTPAGSELVDDASGVVDDVLASLAEGAPSDAPPLGDLISKLAG